MTNTNPIQFLQLSNSSRKNSNPLLHSEYSFFPGTGKEDDTEHNIINVPLCPLWQQVSPDTYRESVHNQVWVGVYSVLQSCVVYCNIVGHSGVEWTVNTYTRVL